MTKEEILKRWDEIIEMDEAALDLHKNEETFLAGHIDGHLKAMRACKQLLEEMI